MNTANNKCSVFYFDLHKFFYKRCLKLLTFTSLHSSSPPNSMFREEHWALKLKYMKIQRFCWQVLFFLFAALWDKFTHKKCGWIECNPYHWNDKTSCCCAWCRGERNRSSNWPIPADLTEVAHFKSQHTREEERAAKGRCRATSTRRGRSKTFWSKSWVSWMKCIPIRDLYSCPSLCILLLLIYVLVWN